jgi:predicted adenine nucleotide alpha hydrolase (AANH) superfamily ATPase
MQTRRAGLAGRERQGAAVLLLCSAEMMETMLASGIDFAIFFYNPNIHPLKEYELRKDEKIHFAGIFGIPFIDATTTATTGSC